MFVLGRKRPDWVCVRTRGPETPEVFTNREGCFQPGTLVEKQESFVRFYMLPNTFWMILNESY